MIPAFLIRPLIYLAAVVAIGGALWYVHHSIDAAGYRRGKAEVTAQYQERDNKALRDVMDAKDKLAAEVKQQRQDFETAIAALTGTYEDKLKNAKNQRNSDVAAARSGAIRLRDNAAKCPASRDSGLPGTPAAAGRSDGEKGAELSGETTANLFDLVNDANSVVGQLDLAQAVIIEQQKKCGPRADRK